MLEPAQVIQLFAKSPDIKTVSAGTVIFQAGEVGDLMYGVIEGEVTLQVQGQVVETIRAGDVFGEGALVQIPPLRASTAVAQTDCRLAALDASHFKFLVQETPLFALEVIRSLSNRLRAFKSTE
ncbi:MAG: cyclic nucleotide-binding domain-containing protein [Cyanobacteriota bacterium]|jgi:CRP-like cAMP-binding protein|nr:cyclic nucleotide-binding domain-containing protein [Cyanobacteriota bacterium]